MFGLLCSLSGSELLLLGGTPGVKAEVLGEHNTDTRPVGLGVVPAACGAPSPSAMDRVYDAGPVDWNAAATLLVPGGGMPVMTWVAAVLS